MTSRVSPEWLDELRLKLARLLADAEERFGENSHGTYPTEVEMTLRIALTTVDRAGKAAREVGPAEVAA